MNDRRWLLAVMAGLLILGAGRAQDESLLYDPDYRPTVDNPAFAPGTGPLILFDEAHNNYHTTAGRYHVFAELATNDGYRVEPNTEPFSAASLADASILVIANALDERNVTEADDQSWVTPVYPALEPEEIQAVVQWVEDGGALLLIASHMPFPGAIDDLALEFGVIWGNTFAFAGNFTFQPGDPNTIQFRLDTPGPCGGIARAHPVFQGRNPDEAIPFVTSFTGSSFRLAPGSRAQPVMELGTGPSSLVAYPTDHLDITLATPMTSAEGLLQGATLHYGEGRVAFMGEAGMFAARKADFVYPGFNMGMSNEELAPHNKQFTLNLLHWLNGLIGTEIPTAVVAAEATARPSAHSLEQNWPNPFNPTTRIQYTVAAPEEVRIDVFNALGQRLRTLTAGEHQPGTYTVTWDGRDDVGQQLRGGVYLYRMRAGAFARTGRMVLLP